VTLSSQITSDSSVSLLGGEAYRNMEKEMNITIQQLVGMLTQQEHIPGWAPKASQRPLRSFSDLPTVAPQEIERLSRSDKASDQLRALGAWYASKEYSKIRALFKRNPDRLGNEGKLLLVLAYLQISRTQSEILERYAAPLVKELANEPSEFGNLYEWFQNFIQERPMPPAFYGPQGAELNKVNPTENTIETSDFAMFDSL